MSIDKPGRGPDPAIPEPDAADLELHDPLARSFPDTLEGKLLFAIAIAFSLFQLATAAHVIDSVRNAISPTS